MKTTWIYRFKMKCISILRQYSIYKRLSWCFGIIFVLPIILIGGYNSVSSFHQNEKEAKTFLEDSSSQIINNISSYLYHHIELLNVVANNPDIINDLEVYKNEDWNTKSSIENHIRLVLGNTFGIGGAINTCELISTNGEYFYYPSPISSGDFYSSELLSKRASEVVSKIGKKEIPSDDRNYIILTRGIFNDEDKCVGNILTALNLEYFNKVCLENVNNLHNKVLILDENDYVISASGEDLVGTQFISNETKAMIISQQIPNTGLTIVNQIDYEILLKSASVEFVITLFMAIFLALIALIFAMIFTQSITGPINHLLHEMNKESINKYVEDSGNDEHHLMIEGFNKMNARIITALEKRYTLKLEESQLNALKKEAELSALQQQINPHFLYNTLESIYWNGQLEGDDEISDMVNALGNYLRAIIDKGREYVTILQEMESVNNYIFLQNKRFQNRITCHWEAAENILKYSILKLALQPIIEDIISESLDYIEDEIVFFVNITQEHNDICVRLYGRNITFFLQLKWEDKINMSGIQSVEERLSLYYGSDYGVSYNWNQKEIQLRLPIYGME